MRIVPGNAQAIGDRDSQQDSFGFSNLDDAGFADHGGVVMVLCDGMGGLANGAAASRAAVTTILTEYRRKPPGETIAAALARVIDAAQAAVCAVSTEDAAAGTTVIVAVICGDTLHWAALGDSRLYLCRGIGPALQLTEDDNVDSLLKRRAGTFAADEQASLEASSGEALTAYLGAPRPAQPQMGTQPLYPGDRVLACSDGVYRDLVPDRLGALARLDDPMAAADAMVREVLDARAPRQDNLTAVLLKVGGGGLLDTIRLPGFDRRRGWTAILAGLVAVAVVGAAIFLVPRLRTPAAVVAAHPVQVLPAATAVAPKPVVPTPSKTLPSEILAAQSTPPKPVKAIKPAKPPATPVHHRTSAAPHHRTARHAAVPPQPGHHGGTAPAAPIAGDAAAAAARSDAVVAPATENPPSAAHDGQVR